MRVCMYCLLRISCVCYICMYVCVCIYVLSVMYMCILSLCVMYVCMYSVCMSCVLSMCDECVYVCIVCYVYHVCMFIIFCLCAKINLTLKFVPNLYLKKTMLTCRSIAPKVRAGIEIPVQSFQVYFWTDYTRCCRENYHFTCQSMVLMEPHSEILTKKPCSLARAWFSWNPILKL